MPRPNQNLKGPPANWRPFYLRLVPGGGEDSLPARAGSGILRRSSTFKNIRHETDLNTAVLGPAVFRGVGFGCFVLAQANHRDLLCRHVLPGKILDHPVGPPFAEFLVIVARTPRVRLAFH